MSTEPWVFSDCICFIDKSIRFAKQFATTKIHCTTKETQRERQGKREREKERFDRATNVIKINYERVSSLRCLLRAIKGKHHLFNAISLLDASQSRRHSCCCCSPHPGSWLLLPRHSDTSIEVRAPMLRLLLLLLLLPLAQCLRLSPTAR